MGQQQGGRGGASSFVVISLLVLLFTVHLVESVTTCTTTNTLTSLEFLDTLTPVTLNASDLVCSPPALADVNAIVFTYTPTKTANFTFEVSYGGADQNTGLFIKSACAATGQMVAGCAKQNITELAGDLYRALSGISLTKDQTYFVFVTSEDDTLATSFTGFIIVSQDPSTGTPPSDPLTPDEIQFLFLYYVTIIVAYTGGALVLFFCCFWFPLCGLCACRRRQTDPEMRDPGGCCGCCSDSVFVKARIYCCFIWLSGMIICLSDWPWTYSYGAYGLTLIISLIVAVIFNFLLNPSPYSSVVTSLGTLQFFLLFSAFLLFGDIAVLLYYMVISYQAICSIPGASPFASVTTLVCLVEKVSLGYGVAAIFGIVLSTLFTILLSRTLSKIAREITGKSEGQFQQFGQQMTPTQMQPYVNGTGIIVQQELSAVNSPLYKGNPMPPSAPMSLNSRAGGMVLAPPLNQIRYSSQPVPSSSSSSGQVAPKDRYDDDIPPV
jgi:hypothetical protein